MFAVVVVGGSAVLSAAIAAAVVALVVLEVELAVIFYGCGCGLTVMTLVVRSVI